MPLKLIRFLYYISIAITAVSWSAALDWQPGVGMGFVIQEENIWWAVLSLVMTVGLYVYQKQLIKSVRDEQGQ